MPSIDQYSIAVRPIEMLFDQTYLSLGTGFIRKQGLNHYLVTNWHNFSGRDPRTGKHLSKTLAEPNEINVWWNFKGKLGEMVSSMIPIRSICGKPLWWIHPAYGNKVDVVALPIVPPENTDVYPINLMPSVNLAIGVGKDVFVLGYPFGIGSSGLPIWKRGSIASEPDFIDPADPHMLIDTASRPGMSGSPVIQKSWDAHTLDNGSIVMNGLSAYRFVGVYSGRLATEDKNDAQLGMVWPSKLLTEIIAGAQLDT